MTQISLRNLPELDESNRNNTLYSRACSYKARGMNDYEMEEAIRLDNQQSFVEPLGETELKSLIKSASKMEQGVPYSSNYKKKSNKTPDIENVFNNVVEMNEGLELAEGSKKRTKKDSEKEWIFVKNYVYTDENGLPIFKKKRFKIIDKETGEVGKATPFEDLINKRNNLDELTDEQKATLYNRVGIKKAREEFKALYITEGEKDADTLIEAGLIATCLKSPGEKIKKQHLNQLEGIKEVYILPDKDRPGFIKAFNLYQGIKDTVKDIKVLVWNEKDIKADPLSKEFAKWDITDQVEAEGYTNEKLINFIKDNSKKEFPDKYLDEIDGKPYNSSLETITKILQNEGSEWKRATDKSKVPPSVVTKILRKYCYFTLIGFLSDTSPLAVYDTEKGIYTTSKIHINTLINAVDDVTINGQKEIYNKLKLSLYKDNEFKRPFTDKTYTVLKNGIYNHESRTLEDFSPQKVFLSRVNTKYNPEATEPEFKGWSFTEWINKISEQDQNKNNQIWQLLATVLRPNYNNKTSFFIYDEKNNTGKSTFLRLLMNLVGEENTSSLDLAQLEDRFYPSTAEGKALIIGDDNDRRLDISKSNNFKRMTAGEYMNVEKKGQDGYQIKFNTTIVQSMNGLPNFKTIDKGLLSRIRIIRFGYQFDHTERNTDVKDKYIYDENLLEYIVYKALDIDIDDIAMTSENEDLLKQLEEKSDPTKSFYNDIVKSQLIASTMLPTEFLYKLYCDYTEFVLGDIHLSHSQFTPRIREHMEADGWEYKITRLTEDFNINEAKEVWLDIRLSDVDSNSVPATPSNNLSIYFSKFSDELLKTPKEKKTFRVFTKQNKQ